MRRKHFFAGRSLAFIVMLLSFLCHSNRSAAQEAGIEKDLVARLSGANNEIVNLASIDLIYTPDNAQTFLIRNVITLSLNEETTSYIPEDFTATVTVQVDYGPNSSSVHSLTQMLSLSYKKAEGIVYGPKQYINFNGAQYVKVTVTNVNAPTLSTASAMVWRNRRYRSSSSDSLRAAPFRLSPHIYRGPISRTARGRAAREHPN